MTLFKHSARNQVAAAARVLDDVNPGWRERVNPETLNMLHPNLCVLGQAWPELLGFEHGVRAVGFDNVFDWYDTSADPARSRAFFKRTGFTPNVFSRFAQQWRREIRKGARS